jgi:hypothetical protein
MSPRICFALVASQAIVLACPAPPLAPDAGDGGDAGPSDSGIVLPDGGPNDGGLPGAPCDLPGSWVHDSSGTHVVPGGSDQTDLSWLTLPQGFCAHHYAVVPNARQLRFAPGGDLFVASRPPGAGRTAWPRSSWCRTTTTTASGMGF